MKFIIITIILFTMEVYAGDWDKTMTHEELSFLTEESTKAWVIIEAPGTYSEFTQDITFTDISRHRRICFEIDDQKRCVDVKWLYEFLRMMDP